MHMHDIINNVGLGKHQTILGSVSKKLLQIYISFTVTVVFQCTFMQRFG